MNSRVEIWKALFDGKSLSKSQTRVHQGVHLSGKKLIDKDGNDVDPGFVRPWNWHLDDEPQEETYTPGGKDVVGLKRLTAEGKSASPHANPVVTYPLNEWVEVPGMGASLAVSHEPERSYGINVGGAVGKLLAIVLGRQNTLAHPQRDAVQCFRWAKRVPFNPSLLTPELLQEIDKLPDSMVLRADGDGTDCCVWGTLSDWRESFGKSGRQEAEEVELLPVVNGRFTAPAPRGFRRSVAEAPTYPAWFRGFRFRGESFETNVPCLWRFRSKDSDVEMLADRNDSKYYPSWNCVGLEWAEFVLWKREAK